MELCKRGLRMRKSYRPPSPRRGSLGPGGPCSDMNFRFSRLFRSAGLIQTLDCPAEPISQGRFQFLARPTAVKGIDGLALLIQRDVAARNISATQVLGHQLVKNALAARPRRLGGIRIQTGRRVLEDKLWTPGRKVGITVTTFLDEFEFRFEDRQKIAFIVAHEWTPTPPQNGSAA